MAQAARKIVPFTPEAAPKAASEPQQPTFARLASHDDEGHESPALALQARVGAAVATAEQPKWSYRKTAAFLMVVNGAFWLTIGFLIVRFVF